MYRLLWAVTARAATPGGWGCGRRGAHQRAGLPQLGASWVGGLGLGLGLGLALGLKLAGTLRSAAPAPPPSDPDPETSPQAEPQAPKEQRLAAWSPQTSELPRSRRFARAIDSSPRPAAQDQGAAARGVDGWEPGLRSLASPRNGAPSLVISPVRADPTPGGGMPAVSCRRKLPVFRPPDRDQMLLGVARVGAEVTARPGHRPFPLWVPSRHTPHTHHR